MQYLHLLFFILNHFHRIYHKNAGLAQKRLWLKFNTYEKRHLAFQKISNISLSFAFLLFLCKPFHLMEVSPHYYRDLKPQDQILKVHSTQALFPQTLKTHIGPCLHISPLHLPRSL